MEDKSVRKRFFNEIEDEEEEEWVMCNRRLNGGKVAAIIIVILHLVMLHSTELPQ
jgi:hypothetical protein